MQSLNHDVSIGNFTSGRAWPRSHSRSVDIADVLTGRLDEAIPRVVRARLVTLGPGEALLISPTPLSEEHVLLKRIAPRFDRKFIECRLLPSPDPDGQESDPSHPEQVYCYGIRFTGFADWSWLTNHLSKVLLENDLAPLPRPSTLRPLHSAAGKAEQSLMPLLSAIGLVVVYACNLTW